MNYGYWVPFVAGGLGTVLIAWLANRGDTNLTQCKSGLLVQAIYMIGAIMFTAISVTFFIPDFYQPGLNDDVWLPPAFIALSILFSWLFVDSLVREIRWDDIGVDTRKLFSAPKHHLWQDVISLNYRPLIQYWRVGFSDGSGFAISEVMRGSKAFVDAYELRMKK